MLGNFNEEYSKIQAFFASAEYKADVQAAVDRLSEKPLVLYGAGLEGVEFWKVLTHIGVKPVCFCDGYKSGVETQTGLKIISPKDLLGDYLDANVMVSTSMYKDEVENYLKELLFQGIAGQDQNDAYNVRSGRILPRELWFKCSTLVCSDEESDDFKRNSHYFLMFGAVSKMLGGFDNELLRGYEETYNLLRDEKSKQVLLDRIMFCLTGTQIYRDPLSDVYFDPEFIRLKDSEVFADCGMYTADTAEVFFQLTGNKYAHYYGFEPDARAFAAACERLEGKRDVTVTAKGLWSSMGTLSFHESHMSCSTVSEDTDGGSGGSSGGTSGGGVPEYDGGLVTQVEVTSLDAFFAGEPHVPTFIKMDIESAELEALKGAEEIIRQHRPKLAICVYHKPEDIYTIPGIIRSFRGDYVFYLRHYTDTICDTILYAV